MTNEQSYKIGDEVIYNGQIATITSWPAENRGFFTWLTTDPQSGAQNSGNGWYGEDITGAPVSASAVLTLHKAADLGEVESTLPPLNLPESLGGAAGVLTEEVAADGDAVKAAEAKLEADQAELAKAQASA